MNLSETKWMSKQELVFHYDKEFKSELKGSVYKEEFDVPKFLIKNGVLIYDFSDIIFPNGFDVMSKNIRSLKNFPQKAGYLNIKYNYIRSLKGLSKDIIALYISYNKIKSLKGLPKKLKELNISNNLLPSLEGLPKKLDFLAISDNPGKFTEKEVRAVCDVDDLIV